MEFFVFLFVKLVGLFFVRVEFEAFVGQGVGGDIRFIEERGCSQKYRFENYLQRMIYIIFGCVLELFRKFKKKIKIKVLMIRDFVLISLLCNLVLGYLKVFLGDFSMQ